MSNAFPPRDESLVHENGHGRISTLAPVEVSVGGATNYGPPPVGGPQNSGDRLDLRKIMAAIRRRSRLMLMTVAAVTALGAVITSLQRPKYQATATILVSTPETGVAVPEGLHPVIASAVQPRSIGTQVAILRSYPVQQAAIKRLKQPDREVAKRLMLFDVRPQFGAEAVDVLSTSSDPVIAAKGANALCDEYLLQNEAQNRAQMEAATRDVHKDLLAVRERLNVASTELRNYKQRNGTVDLGEEQRVRIAQQSQIEADLRQAQTERAAGTARIAQLMGQIEQMAPTEVVPDRIVRRPAVEAMKGQLTQLELQRIALLRRYRPNSPEVSRLDAQMTDIRSKLSEEAQTEIGSWTRSVNPVRMGLVQDVARAQGEVWSLDARAAALRAEASRTQAALQQLPEREYRLSQLLTDQAALQQTYRVLNEKFQTLRINEGTRLTNARVLARALPPENPISPRKFLNLALAFACGVALALLLAAIAELTDERIRSADEAETVSYLPVLAEFPAGQELSRLSAGETHLSPLAERFRLLRTNMAFAARSQGVSTPRSILVTCSQDGKGATITAVNLAISAANSGKNVVLVDGDWRHPQLHSVLGCANEVGFSSVLTGEVALEPALQETGIPGLLLLATGPSTPDAVELIESPRAYELTSLLASLADMVIVASPSPLEVADTQIIAQWMDAAVVVISSDTTTQTNLTRTRDALTQTGVCVLGLVLIKPNGKKRSFSQATPQHSLRTAKEGAPALASRTDSSS